MPSATPPAISIILVEPQSPGNIGMVCRAMANFGMTDLRLVKPCTHLHHEARKFAVSAGPLLGSARIFESLQEAIADLHLSVATTRREGRLRGRLLEACELPSLMRPLPQEARAGLVFGREDSGLSSEEVSLCSHAATITTAQGCGSLNLAQAVILFLYELCRPAGEHPAAPQRSQLLPEQQELEGLFGQMEEVLSRIAFLNPSRPDAVLNRLRSLVTRAQPDQGEVALLRALWGKLEESVNDWKGRLRGQARHGETPKNSGGKTG